MTGQSRPPVPVGIDGLADVLTGPPRLGAGGGVVEPLVLAELDRVPGPAQVAALARTVAGSGRIVVGVATDTPDPALGPLLAALDLSLAPAAGSREVVAVADPVAASVELAGAVMAHPQAALVLAGLLRWSGSLAVEDALDAESFVYSTLLGGQEFRAWLARRGDRPLPPPAVEPVLVERTGGDLHVTLNRPGRRNAYGRELRDALVAALQVPLLDRTITALVLDGTGPSFCSGGDLDEFGTTPDLVTAHFVRTRAGAGRLLHQLADRTTVRVHGSCVGAGVELPAFAGRIVADPGTTFRLPEIAMGLIPGAGGTVAVPRRIGRFRTLHLALTGRGIDSVTALDWGLIDAVERGRGTGHDRSLVSDTTIPAGPNG